MTSTTNGRLIFNEIPADDGVPLNGGFILKTLALSLDPYLRNLMRRPSNPVTFEECSVFFQHRTEALSKIDNQCNLPWSVFVGVAGMPAQTAYFGWKEYSYSRAKKGEVAFVTSGAGAVGSYPRDSACQDGMEIIASAGSDEKVKFMMEIGADVAFNYETTKTSEVLAKEGPIYVYWDNVGGESLEAALDAAAEHARFIARCAVISGYNTNPCPVTGFTINEFVVTTLLPKYVDAFYKENTTRGL
ncbi:hypothetical protein PAXRUDRAFT_30808 [Paxillus rubicundulus Ve08.2h10]|uniref:Alcohol dehydrogenase-like C-terminal domain-containing protein n=1 Tax=Paxillus rubicundulus Ve08.2h10 TaxID=930991 RepID=A0A0D0DKJ5_9AGAM|nr:hypothetical protein PAXRUDRAFT_30808 [Paxillus rubicundulus Ve08.2h10]